MKCLQILALQWHDCGGEKDISSRELRILMTLLNKRKELRESETLGDTCADLLLPSPVSRAGLRHRLGLSACLCWILQTAARMMIFPKCKFEPDILLLENPY